MQRRQLRGAAIALGLALSGGAAAFSQGAPICEVLQLPLVEMSPVLAQPPPSGWRLTSAAAAYQSGQTITLEITHPQPRSVRGVLLWAKRGALQGSGSFPVTPTGLWQHIPAPAECGSWAISHRDAAPKSQSVLQFRWVADTDADQTLFRAFLIEDCGQTDCRAHQALTSLLVLERVLHRDGFEPAANQASQTGQEGSDKSSRRRPPVHPTRLEWPRQGDVASKPEADNRSGR